MTTTLADPRTEQVQRNADDVDHVICWDCGWKPGMPMLCGAPDDGTPVHDGPCPHPTCPLCELEWERHERTHRPWWKRWLP
ncbi:MAG TPA: hypothetical protein VF484_00850 [Candidatus Limnocylindrales bacterium]